MKGFFRSFVYALNGIVYVIRTQRNMKVHLVATLFVVTVGLFLRLNTSEWVDIFAAVFFVLAAECLNTSIEAIVDLISPHKHPLAKVAKDCAAGAVMLAAGFSIIVAGFVLLPKLLALGL